MSWVIKRHVPFVLFVSGQGHHFGWTRTQCDNTFERDMHKLCENHSSGRKRLIFSKERRCRTAAKMYFLAPKTVGSPSLSPLHGAAMPRIVEIPIFPCGRPKKCYLR